MIKNLEIGEIVRIKNREWLVVETPIGNSDKKRPDLVLLDNVLKNINRKPYYSRKGKDTPIKNMKSFKGIKLINKNEKTNNKNIKR